MSDAAQRPAQTHELKTWPEWFQPAVDGLKNYEVRNNDRDFRTGDYVVLKEYRPAGEGKPGTYTGRELRRRVIHIMPGGAFGIAPDVVILGLGRA